MNVRTKHAALALAAAGAIALAAPEAGAQIYGGGSVGVGGVGVSGGVSVGVAPAYAQPQPVYAQPQPVYAQPQPVYVQQQPVVYQQQPAMMYAPQRRLGRFRAGFDIGGGYQFMGSLTGASLTGSLRLGWQLNDNLAIYYQGDIPIGFVGGNDSFGRSYGGASIMVGNALMGEWHFTDWFGLALGPSIDYSAAAICSDSLTSSCAGAFFGIQARASFTLVASGGQDMRRYGFRVGVGSHTTFISGVVVESLDLHLGYEWF